MNTHGGRKERKEGKERKRKEGKQKTIIKNTENNKAARDWDTGMDHIKKTLMKLDDQSKDDTEQTS